MIYVFDTSSLRALQHFYPRVFTSIWAGLDILVEEGRLISTREVYRELEVQAVSDEIRAWAKINKIYLPDQRLKKHCLWRLSFRTSTFNL